MIFGGHAESLVILEGRQGNLFLEEDSGFFPGFFPLIGLVDHIFIDGDFFIVEEGVELLVDEIDIIGRKLPGEVDKFYHLSLVAHLPFRTSLYRTINDCISNE